MMMATDALEWPFATYTFRPSYWTSENVGLLDVALWNGSWKAARCLLEAGISQCTLSATDWWWVISSQRWFTGYSDDFLVRKHECLDCLHRIAERSRFLCKGYLALTLKRLNLFCDETLNEIISYAMSLPEKVDDYLRFIQ